MTIVVTGAAGFIGMHVARALLKRGERVVGLDDINDYYDPALKRARLAEIETHPGFAFHRLDIADRAAVARAFDAHPDIDQVVHLAAQAGVRKSLEDPYRYVASNVMGHLVMMEACRARSDRIRHFVYASSSSVYGDNRKLPFSVDDRVDSPQSLYAATKRADELMSGCYVSLFGVPMTGLRFFTVYGPWGRPDMAVWIFTEAILRGAADPGGARSDRAGLHLYRRHRRRGHRCGRSSTAAGGRAWRSQDLQSGQHPAGDAHAAGRRYRGCLRPRGGEGMDSTCRPIFGTDGVRGRANSWPMTPEVALRLGQAAGRCSGAAAITGRVVIGKDTRLSGYMIESALQAGFTSAGHERVPARAGPDAGRRHADALAARRCWRDGLGVPQPFEDNGIKLFGPDGYKLSDAVEAEIEALDGRPPRPRGAGRHRPRAADRGRRRALCRVRQGDLSQGPLARRSADRGRLRQRRRLSHRADGAVGARRRCRAARRDAGRDQHQRGCGSTAPEACRRKVLETRADLGVALDGDADRCTSSTRPAGSSTATRSWR
jgi:NAD(P)-dependent dehydrogenase (short-subunit alcohol dehydrogenase family)